MGSYKLSSRAALDIAEIFEYGIHKFGLSQAQKYLNELESSLHKLPDRAELRKDASFIRPALCRYKFNSHIVFFTLEGENIFIVRILGQFMDFKRHL